MIGHPNPLNDDDDADFHSELRFLREIEPPPHLRSQCMAAATQAITEVPQSMVNARETRRRLTAQFACAVAASLMIGIGIGWSLRGSPSRSHETPQVHEHPDNALASQPMNRAARNVHAASIAETSNAATSTVLAEESFTKGSMRQHETYLCGVGRIRSNTMFFVDGE